MAVLHCLTGVSNNLGKLSAPLNDWRPKMVES